MTPTFKLRFVERKVSVPFKHYDDVAEVKTARILQQWWEKDIASQYNAAITGDPSGEWRDVPVEQEGIA